MKQGEVWAVNLNPTVGSKIKKTKPAIIVNDDALGKLPLRIITKSLD
jgi:mRNA interferase MazF